MAEWDMKSLIRVMAMEVKLLTHTPEPEKVCAVAMIGCQSKSASFELSPSKDKIVEMIRKAKAMKHLSVLEHASFTFSVKNVSRVCTHQLVRHRIASYSQSSGRARNFGKLTEYDFIIPPTITKATTATNKAAYVKVLEHYKKCIEMYNYLINSGIPKEDARFILPEATPQNITFTMNARELLHFFYLRLSEHAQWEIKGMARRMLDLLKEVAPVMFEDAGKYEC
jgi:thymidylate synthase (FAD)